MIRNVLFAFLLTSSFFVSCCKQSGYVTNTGAALGTFYEIKYHSLGNVNYENEIAKLLSDFSQSLSTYIPTSLISSINQNDTTVITDEYFRIVFNKAVEINKLSGGAFDITIAPIVNLWGFGFTDDIPDIDSLRIDSLLQYVGMDKIHIDGDRIIKDIPELMLDMNSIAKGYCVDIIANFLRANFCQNYLVNIGGEISAQGVNDSCMIWRVGIEQPKDNLSYGKAYQSLLYLNNRSIATSGNNRRFFKKDGIKYSHTIDPKTGYPVQHNLLSASIVADDCMTADAWATTCLVLGLDKSIEILRQHPELDALLIYRDENGGYKTYETEGMREMIYYQMSE